MKRVFSAACFAVVAAVSFAAAQSVRLVRNDAAKRVDVTVDGKAFTSYRWDERIFRPVLYPIISSGGSFITRGFPFETRDGETVDHPHQVGCSLSYGSVNGIDFWNSSTFRSAEEMKKMGRVQHREIISIKSGRGQGELVVIAQWKMPTQAIVLSERTKYTFGAAGERRWVDRETTLTANGEDVVFGDSKEGMFGLHLASELEQSDQTKVKVTSKDGVITERGPSTILSGVYSNSEGLTGDKVWGTLGKWASVSGNIGKENVAVAIFDHPKNVNFPSRMMVRGYGLLALNPFGQKLLDPKLSERKYVWQLIDRSLSVIACWSSPEPRPRNLSNRNTIAFHIDHFVV